MYFEFLFLTLFERLWIIHNQKHNESDATLHNLYDHGNHVESYAIRQLRVAFCIHISHEMISVFKQAVQHNTIKRVNKSFDNHHTTHIFHIRSACLQHK